MLQVFLPMPRRADLELGRRSSALLRQLCGRDEDVAAGNPSLVATELLDRLIVESPSATVKPGDVWSLPLTNRDWLIAALFLREYGPRIDSQAACESCGETFELSFRLDELMTELLSQAEDAAVEGPDADGAYALRSGLRFRLPTPEDERAVAALPAEAATARLLERCLVTAGSGDMTAPIEDAMSRIAPLLDLDLAARCAACGAAQSVRFDVASYFIHALERERPILAREIHSLASAYHWPWTEIVDLPRAVRRAHVELVEAERERRQRPWGI